MPSAMPARSAGLLRGASCSSISHCSQHWKSISAWCSDGEVPDRVRGPDPAGPPASRRSAARAPPPAPHQVAKSCRPMPFAAAGRPPRDASRPGVRGTEKMISSGLALGLPGPVPVDPVVRVAASTFSLTRISSILARCLSAWPGVLGDPFDPQVERVREPAAGRQVRRRLHRRHRFGGVHRVDQHVVGAVLGWPTRPRDRSRSVRSPTPQDCARAHAVELGRQSPAAPAAHPVREAEPGRA